MAIKDKLLSTLTPALAWGLNLACPVVPQFVWEALITAILNGNVTLEHILSFMKEHDIQTFDEYPTGRNGQSDKPVISLASENTNINKD